GLDGAPGAATVLFGGAGSRTGLALPGLAPLLPARLGGGGGALGLLLPGGGAGLSLAPRVPSAPLSGGGAAGGGAPLPAEGALPGGQQPGGGVHDVVAGQGVGPVKFRAGHGVPRIQPHAGAEGLDPGSLPDRRLRRLRLLDRGGLPAALALFPAALLFLSFLGAALAGDG